MPTVESITKRLDDLDKDRGYFGIEDLIWAYEMAGESMFEVLHREHPLKTFNPAMVQGLLKEQSPGDRSE